MIDTLLRPHLLPVIDTMAAKVAQSGFSANQLTLIAFAFGIAGCFAVGMQAYPLGLLLLLLNRFLDALAGSIARKSGVTDFGTILDLLCDYLIFAGFAFLFSLSAMETMMASTFLIFSFLAMGMAYFAHAWILARKNIADMPRGGIVQNGEMIVFIALACLMPAYYAAFAAVFALLCWVTAILRFRTAAKTSKKQLN
jgi:phosphatidylglycerophosphate synthase